MRLARDSAPDVVLMDIRMPGRDGLAATRDIVADPGLSEVRVVVLTTFAEDGFIFEAIRAGASGFLVKDIEPADLIQGVRVAYRGDALLSPAVTRRLIEEFAARAKPPHPSRELSALLNLLTEREREVPALVAGGLSNDEIAQRLVVSPATAKTHVSRTMIKLGARDRAQLVIAGYESGLVRPGRFRARGCSARNLRDRCQGVPRRGERAATIASPAMDDHAGSDEEYALSVRLDLDLDRRPISGRLRTEQGIERRFVGWLGFIEALRSVHELQGGPTPPETGGTPGGSHDDRPRSR